MRSPSFENLLKGAIMDLGMLPSRSFENEIRAVRKRNASDELRY
jgi:hypothetical protein